MHKAQGLWWALQAWKAKQGLTVKPALRAWAWAWGHRHNGQLNTAATSRLAGCAPGLLQPLGSENSNAKYALRTHNCSWAYSCPGHICKSSRAGSISVQSWGPP